jgi:vancomycin resistance protein YoaR
LTSEPEAERALDRGPRTRAIEPKEERSLPPEAGVPRSVPTPWIFRRRGLTILSYLFIVVAVVVIAAIGYATYTFSRYQDVILPGVYVSSVNVGDTTPAEAEVLLYNRLDVIGQIPIHFTFDGRGWTPGAQYLRLAYDLNATVNNAYTIGRSGSIWRNFFDRLPLRRHIDVPLVTLYSKPRARAWIQRTLVPVVRRPMINAWLVMRNANAVVEPSQSGRAVDTAEAFREIETAMGTLDSHTMPVPAITTPPAISDSSAATVADRINTFLAHPPIFRFGHTVVPTSSSTLAGMLTFPARPVGSSAALRANIDDQMLTSYVQQLIWPPHGYDIVPQAPRFDYGAGVVTVLASAQAGRSANWGMAAHRLLEVFRHLTPGARITIPVRHTRPPIDLTNPASLGVSTLLGEGRTSFAGSPSARVADIQSTAAQLNGVLIRPGDEISFNYYANRGVTGTGWPSRVYDDSGHMVSGVLYPGQGGAMNQVATTFFRAGYAAGLRLLERHAHAHRLPWYQPPGMDAAVTPNGEDLQFRNTTGGYLLIETRFEPVQQVLYVYIYGRQTGWTVNISSPSMIAAVPAGPPLQRPDPSLVKGRQVVLRTSQRGVEFQVTRTVTLSSRGASPPTSRDTLDTSYEARPAIILVGTGGATPQPTPTPSATPGPTSTPQPTPTLRSSRPT